MYLLTTPLLSPSALSRLPIDGTTSSRIPDTHDSLDIPAFNGKRRIYPTFLTTGSGVPFGLQHGGRAVFIDTLVVVLSNV